MNPISISLLNLLRKHLVEKLGEVALNLEVTEEQTKEIFDEEKKRDSDEESQDMFGSSQAYIDNPLLKEKFYVKVAKQFLFNLN